MKNIKDYKGMVNNPFPERDEHSIDQIAANIKRLPKLLDFRPIIINSDNEVIAGNKRFKALIKLGYDKVPNNWIREAKDFTPEEIKTLIVIDNTNEGEWDIEILMKDFREFDFESIGLDIDLANFDPDLNPGQSEKDVSQADLDKQAKEQGIKLGETKMVEVTCPHCGESFEFKA